MSSVLEKIDLPDERGMILHHAFAPLTNKFRRAQVREESKVAPEKRFHRSGVRLLGFSLLRSQAWRVCD